MATSGRNDRYAAEPPGTLGDVLYTASTERHPTEKDWVGLVHRVAARDQAAFRELYDRAHRLVYTLVVRIVNNRETAEEVTVDVFHDVWRRAEAYDHSAGPVLGWIMNQARSRAIDRLRFDQRKKRTSSGEHAIPEAPASDPRDALDVREQGRAVREALGALTPDERLAIETAFFSEMTYGEVAQRLSQPLGTVKTRIRSGLGKLRQALAPAQEGS